MSSVSRLMQGRTKQQVVSEFRSAEILNAARKVFSKRGFNDVTVDEIAAAAGLAKATVYQYFPSKQEIYLAALRHGIRELVDRTRRNIDTAQGVREKIEAFVRTRLAYLEEHREFFAVYHAEFGNLTHPAILNREFRGLYQQQLELLESLIRAGVKSGEVSRVAPPVLATMIYEASRGLMLRRALGWTESTVEQEVTALMNMIWKGIGNR